MGVDFGLNQVEMMLIDPGVTDLSKAADTHRIYAGMQALNATRVRIEAVWSYLEPSRGQFNWADLDRALILANEYGLQPLLILGVHRPGAVAFGQFILSSGWANAADYGNMCRAVANRYGPNGLGIVSEYEIWNEQNHYGFWGAGMPEPSAYVPYLKAATDNIRAVQPDAFIVTGGLMPIGTLYGFAMDPVPYVEGMYSAGAQGYFDALGNHPYTLTYGFEHQEPTEDQLFIAVDERLHEIMTTNGDGAKKIWWTEIGWPSPLVIDEATKADWFEKQIALWQAKTHVGPFFVYNYRDSSAQTSDSNMTFGLVTWGYAKKQPTWDYIATLNDDQEAPAAFFGSGTLSMLVQPSPTPAFSGTGSLTVVARVAVAASFSGVGALAAPLFGRPAAEFSGVGTLACVVHQSYSRTADFAGTGVLSAGASTAVSRSATFSGSGALAAQPAQQKSFEYIFTGTGSTKPTSLFTDFGLGWGNPTGPFTPSGLGYQVSGGVARNTNSGAEGYYYSGGIYLTDHLSADHSSEVQIAPGYFFTLSGDRSILAIVRATPDGSSWVASAMHWNSPSSCQIITCIEGVITVRVSGPGHWQSENDRMKLVPEGNTYTVYRNGVATGTSWTDLTGVFPGANNTRSGFGFQHIRAGGLNWDTGGLSEWAAADLEPTNTIANNPAAFTGAGSLTAVTQVSLTATFSGAGMLSATADEGGNINRPAALTGTGSLTASVSTLYDMAAAFSGAGVLAAQAILASLDATFTGSGTLTATVAQPVQWVSTGTGAFVIHPTSDAGWSHTIATSGPDTIVLAGVYRALNGAGTSTMTVTYGGVAMTELANRVFYLWNPPNGTQSVVLSESGTATRTVLHGNTVAYKNVAQIAFTGTAATDSSGQITVTDIGAGEMQFFVGTRDSAIFGGVPTLRYTDSSGSAGTPDSIVVTDGNANGTFGATTGGALNYNRVELRPV